MENKTPSSMSILAWAVCIFLLLSLRLSFAQESVVQGIVTDEQGKAIKNARLTLLDPATGLKFVLKTDKDGKFMKVGIPRPPTKSPSRRKDF